jgi:hypothetical protein
MYNVTPNGTMIILDHVPPIGPKSKRELVSHHMCRMTDPKKIFEQAILLYAMVMTEATVSWVSGCFLQEVGFQSR